jgi:hypothetical protein
MLRDKRVKREKPILLGFSYEKRSTKVREKFIQLLTGRGWPTLFSYLSRTPYEESFIVSSRVYDLFSLFSFFSYGGARQ